MSSETGAGETLSSQDTSKPSTSSIEERDLGQLESEPAQAERTSPPKQKEESQITGDREEVYAAERKLPSSKDGPGETLDSGEGTGNPPRQVIAVSASKGPAAFFNLARKFLVTDEMCDLSALEGAIVSAVDAAHLLERSQLATIVRVNTSYVTVEPKRKKQQAQQSEQEEDAAQQPQTRLSPTTGDKPGTSVATEPVSSQEKTTVGEGTRQEETSTTGATPTKAGGSRGSSGGRELRRARIVITVRRTESYKQWLEENPLQAIIAGEGDTESNVLGQTPSDRKQTE